MPGGGDVARTTLPATPPPALAIDGGQTTDGHVTDVAHMTTAPPSATHPAFPAYAHTTSSLLEPPMGAYVYLPPLPGAAGAASIYPPPLQSRGTRSKSPQSSLLPSSTKQTTMTAASATCHVGDVARCPCATLPCKRLYDPARCLLPYAAPAAHSPALPQLSHALRPLIV